MPMKTLAQVLGADIDVDNKGADEYSEGIFADSFTHKAINAPSHIPATRLDYRVAVYVPAPQYVEEVAEALAREHGGATVHPGFGYWIDAQGKLVRDETSVVFAYSADPDIEQLLHLAGIWCRQWEQDSVAVECDGALYLVELSDSTWRKRLKS